MRLLPSRAAGRPPWHVRRAQSGAEDGRSDDGSTGRLQVSLLAQGRLRRHVRLRAALARRPRRPTSRTPWRRGPVLGTPMIRTPAGASRSHSRRSHHPWVVGSSPTRNTTRFRRSAAASRSSRNDPRGTGTRGSRRTPSRCGPGRRASPRRRTVDLAPLWWADGVGQAGPGHLRLRGA